MIPLKLQVYIRENVIALLNRAWVFTIENLGESTFTHTKKMKFHFIPIKLIAVIKKMHYEKWNKNRWIKNYF